jgi:hypothetical protein
MCLGDSIPEVVTARLPLHPLNATQQGIRREFEGRSRPARAKWHHKQQLNVIFSDFY